MPHSERVRKRVLRLKGVLAGMPKDSLKRPSFERELSNLITGKKPTRPVGATVGVKLTKPKRRK